jgi:peptidyl-dipeptidase Dcp
MILRLVFMSIVVFATTPSLAVTGIENVSPGVCGTGLDPDNVFLSIASNQPFAFDKLKFEHFEPAMKWDLMVAQQKLDDLRNSKEAPTYENTIEVLEQMGDPYRGAFNMLENFSVLGPNGYATEDQIGDLASKYTPKIKEFSYEGKFGTKIIFDPILYARVKAIDDQKEKLNLTKEQKMLLQKTLNQFIGGMAEAQVERVKEIDARLAEILKDFDKNLSTVMAKTELVVTDSNRLKGIPEDVVAAAAARAEKGGQPGKWAFNLQPSQTYGPIMDFAEDRGLREQIWRLYTTRGARSNADSRPIILEAVRLRDERAKIVLQDKYATHLDFQMRGRMAKDAKTVHAFLDSFVEPYSKQAKIELAELQELARKDGIEQLKPWGNLV